MKLIILTLVFLLAISSQIYALEWYQGGDLHTKTGEEWHKSSLRNKIATIADFVATIDPSLFKEYFYDYDSTTGILREGKLKERIYFFKDCISEATSIPSTKDLKINVVDALCSVLKYP